MKIKDIILGIAIIILTVFVTFYGINTLFPSPEYEDFCNEFKTTEVIDTVERCEEIGGKWNSDIVPRPVVEEGKVVEGYCDRDYTCRQDYEDARKVRAQKVFFVALPIGILIILLGAFKFGLETVGAGLMGGGVGTLIYGSGAFWPYTQDWIRFLLSLVGLVALIWFTYWFNKRHSKK